MQSRMDAKAFVNGCVLGTALWAAIFLILLLLTGCQQPANGQTYQEGPATTQELKLYAKGYGVYVYKLRMGLRDCIVAAGVGAQSVAVDCT